MVEQVIRALIYICIIVLLVLLAIYVLGVLGFVIPAGLMPIIWLIVGLVVVLILWRAFGSSLHL